MTWEGWCTNFVHIVHMCTHSVRRDMSYRPCGFPGAVLPSFATKPAPIAGGTSVNKHCKVNTTAKPLPRHAMPANQASPYRTDRADPADLLQFHILHVKRKLFILFMNNMLFLLSVSCFLNWESVGNDKMLLNTI